MCHHNNCDESLFRSIKRVLKTKATVEHFFEKSVPDMLYHITLQYCGRPYSRGVRDQLGRIQDGHIHRDMMEKAIQYCRDTDMHVYRACRGKGANQVVTWYVNSTNWLATSSDPAVTRDRVKKFLNLRLTVVETIEEFEERHLSLHVISQLSCEIDGEITIRLVCSCAGFWNCNSHCSHILVIYHVMGKINLIEMISGLVPVRKRGRPTTSEMALERDKDSYDIKTIEDRPQAFRKTWVRHPIYLNGIVVDYRVKPDEANTTVWQCRFPDAPGGQQNEELTQEEFIDCQNRYLAMSTQLTKISAEAVDDWD
jgi:hypothetical protein